MSSLRFQIVEPFFYYFRFRVSRFGFHPFLTTSVPFFYKKIITSLFRTLHTFSL